MVIHRGPWALCGAVLLTATLASAKPADDGGAGAHLAREYCRLVEGPTPLQDFVECGSRRFVLAGLASEADELPPGSAEFYIYVCAAVCCILTAALAAGLTMGTVSLDAFDLDLLLEMRTDELASDRAREELLADQKSARALRPLIADHYFAQVLPCVPKRLDPTNKHYLLVTLLIVNAMANEALPVFLDHLVPAWAAVVISVSFVLVFGEIIPSAIFTGPNQLSIAARLAPVVALLKFMLMPLVWPISLLLDSCLEHEEGSSFSRGKIKALVRLHEHDDEWLHNNGLTREEIDMIHGTLDLHTHVVQDAQESMADAKMLPLSTILDENTMADLVHWGHSRIFVYDGDRGNVRGILMVKKLIVVDPGSRRPLSQFPLRRPIVVSPRETLLETLNRFQTGHSHLAIISSNPAAVLQAWDLNEPLPEDARPMGFLTLEDIIEELIREDVLDEAERRSVIQLLEKAGKMTRLRTLAAAARKRVKSRKIKEQQDALAAAAAGAMRVPLLGSRSSSEASVNGREAKEPRGAMARWRERFSLNGMSMLPGGQPARRGLAEATVNPSEFARPPDHYSVLCAGRPARRALAEE